MDTVVISEREGIRKPDPKIFIRAAERVRVPPQQCLFVGDNPEADIGGALAAGMQAVWRRGAIPWPEGLRCSPTATVEALSALLGSLPQESPARPGG